MLHNALHIQSNNYNAGTNTPALATATGYNDNIFQVTTQGIQTINGVSSFCGVGDQIIVSNAVSQFYVVLPVQYNAATGAVGALAVTITQLQQVGRIITISVAGTQTINGVSVAMVVGQAWEYNGSSWLNITNPFATQAQVNAGVVNNLPLAPSTFAASSQLAALAPLASPAFTGIPTAPTAALGTNTTQVASTAFVLANANTSDSYATQAQVNAGVVSNLAIAPSTFAASTQLAAKAPLASPALTGTPTVPTAALGTNTTQVASTAFVLANANTSDSYATQAQVNAGVVSNLAIAPSTFAASSQLAALAPLASPAFTGIPTAPTAALGTNTTQVASTAFVLANANTSDSYATQAEVNAGTITNKAVAPSTFAASTQLAAKAPLVSPALTGTPTAPTAAVGTNTTQLATTAFVQSHIAPGNYAQLAANNTFTGTNTFSGLTNGSIGALKQITNFGTNVTYGVVSISTNGAQVPHANLTVQGNGDSNGYGVAMTTPNGVYAPAGNSQLGALTMQQRSVANLGISYPNIPGATSYTMGFGWDGSHVRCMVDNNTGVVPVLANFKGNPIVSSNAQNASNTTIGTSVSFTAPNPGVLLAIGNTNYGSLAPNNNSSILYINGVNLASDNTNMTRALVATTTCGAGAVSASLTAASTSAFTAYITLVFIPYL